MIRSPHLKHFLSLLPCFLPSSASLKRLFVVPRLSHESTSSLEELLEVLLPAMAYLRLHFRKSEHSSSTDSFLSFKAEISINFCFVQFKLSDDNFREL
ncbi:hypothetical protein Tco_1245703 [Tanacetum coccineum]|uniref:Uncharacterized protein n=1 Tax=Tanacetum coccineum TaxID=301880 RepID=A0ABQ5INC9_9ASTR